MSSSSEENSLIILTSSDKVEFTVKQSVAKLSATIKKNLIDHEKVAPSTIPIPNVSSKTLATVLEFMEKHADCQDSDSMDVKEFDENFVDGKEIPELYHLLMAADYLEIKVLVRVICKKIADIINDMMPEKVREIFGIEKGLTDEEEAKIREEQAWAFKI